jgi:hypothetical protein
MTQAKRNNTAVIANAASECRGSLLTMPNRKEEARRAIQKLSESGLFAFAEQEGDLQDFHSRRSLICGTYRTIILHYVKD